MHTLYCTIIISLVQSHIDIEGSVRRVSGWGQLAPFKEHVILYVPE